MHPTPKNQVLHCVHYKFLCYLSKKLQNISHFVTLFSAHGDIVVYLIPKKNKKTKRRRKKALLHAM
jgi:hypothetical protein